MFVLQKIIDAAFFPQLTNMKFLLVKHLSKGVCACSHMWIMCIFFLVSVPYFHLAKLCLFLKTQFNSHLDHKVLLNYYVI